MVFVCVSFVCVCGCVGVCGGCWVSKSYIVPWHVYGSVVLQDADECFFYVQGATTHPARVTGRCRWVGGLDGGVHIMPWCARPESVSGFVWRAKKQSEMLNV